MSERTAHPTKDAAADQMPVRLLLILALLASFSPLATDLYLPGFPKMTRDLQASASGVQLTLTTFLVGLAVGQLVFGPLSDRLGRRRPLFVSTLVCVAACAFAAVAPNIMLLNGARFVQGVAGAGGVVIGRAVITDLHAGKAAAKAFTLMMTVGGIAPVLAPFLGSLLIGPIGWRGILLAITGLCALMFVLVLLWVPETLPASNRHQQTSFAAALRQVTKEREFLWNAAVFMSAFGVLMGYISSSPFIYQDIIGMSVHQYGIAFGVNAAGMVALGWVAARALDRVGPIRIVAICLLVQLVSCVAFIGLVLVHAPTWSYVIPIFTAVLVIGGIMGSSTGMAMSSVRHIAGTASAVLGAGQYMLGALVAPLVGLGGTKSALVPAIVMAVAALCGNLAAARARALAR